MVAKWSLRVTGVGRNFYNHAHPGQVALDHLPQESGKSHTRLFAAASSEAIILFLPSILFGIILALKEATAI